MLYKYYIHIRDMPDKPGATLCRRQRIYSFPKLINGRKCYNCVRSKAVK